VLTVLAYEDTVDWPRRCVAFADYLLEQVKDFAEEVGTTLLHDRPARSLDMIAPASRSHLGVRGAPDKATVARGEMTPSPSPGQERTRDRFR
jgi:hypothetical protein